MSRPIDKTEPPKATASALEPGPEAGGEPVPADKDTPGRSAVAESAATPSSASLSRGERRGAAPPLLEVRHLHQRFGDVVAVEDVSFAIEKGVCFGLLGPNGAGKSTTIEIIEGIRKPTRGEVLYRGAPRDAGFKRRIGIQFQATALMDFLTVHDTLRTFAAMYPSPRPLKELIAICELEAFLDRDVAKLSGGQRQRCLLALALVNDPEILFLDEPTTGLDPQSRRNLWRLIDEIRAEGRTIVLTTHYMEEAELLCDMLAIIDGGRIIEQGAPAALLEKHYGHTLVTLDRTAWPAGMPFSEPHHFEDDTVVIETRNVPATLSALAASPAALDSLRVKRPTLEDLFIKLTGHRLRE